MSQDNHGKTPWLHYMTTNHHGIWIDNVIPIHYFYPTEQGHARSDSSPGVVGGTLTIEMEYSRYKRMEKYVGCIDTDKGVGYVWQDETADYVVVFHDKYYVIDKEINSSYNVYHVLWGGYSISVRYRRFNRFAFEGVTAASAPPLHVDNVHMCVTRIRNSVCCFACYTFTRSISHDSIISKKGFEITNWKLTREGIIGDCTFNFTLTTPKIQRVFRKLKRVLVYPLLEVLEVKRVLVYPLLEVLEMVDALPLPIAEEISREIRCY